MKSILKHLKFKNQGHHYFQKKAISMTVTIKI